VIPLYTRLYIEGYGPAIAGDIGGAIKGHKIDLCFDTLSEALDWGRRPATVYILADD
jgi:3D (Asp-Asp-Asp) domain-containing protein